MRWHMRRSHPLSCGQYALVLTEVEATPFVACRGWQGLWNVPDDVLAKLQEAA